MLYIKIHKIEKGEIVAVCDEELLGRSLKEGKVVLDLKTYSGFYEGELLSEGEVAARIEKTTLFSANVVGKRSVEVFVSKGLAKQDEVRKIAGVPTIHIYRVDY